MKIGKLLFNSVGIVILLIVGVIIYLLLTINKKPIEGIETADATTSYYVVPDAIVNVPQEKETVSLRDVAIPASAIEQTAEQLTLDAKTSTTKSNKVVTFNSASAKQQAEQKIAASNNYKRITSEDGQEFYQQKTGKRQTVFFPDDQTMVISEDRNIANKSTANAPQKSDLQNKEGMAFSFDKTDEQVQSVLKEVPSNLSNRFESVSGLLSESEKPSYIKITMENAIVARSLEVALPKAINRIQKQMNDLDGQLVLQGNVISLNAEELATFNEIVDDMKIKASKKDVYLIVEEQAHNDFLNEMIRNVMIN